jgi:HSP20 family protein
VANLIRRNETTRQELMPAWEPFRLMRDLMGWDPFAAMLPSTSQEPALFAPRFEVKETAEAYVFHADLPGLAAEDVDLSLTANRLTVSGARRAEQRQEGETYYAYERSYGSFSRSFALPEGIDVDHAEADLKNGVLTIAIPKQPEHQPRKISLKNIGDKVKGVLGGKEKGQA